MDGHHPPPPPFFFGFNSAYARSRPASIAKFNTQPLLWSVLCVSGPVNIRGEWAVLRYNPACCATHRSLQRRVDSTPRHRHSLGFSTTPFADINQMDVSVQ
jgi:hypothetical protein